MQRPDHVLMLRQKVHQNLQLILPFPAAQPVMKHACLRTKSFGGCWSWVQERREILDPRPWSYILARLGRCTRYTLHRPSTRARTLDPRTRRMVQARPWTGGGCRMGKADLTWSMRSKGSRPILAFFPRRSPSLFFLCRCSCPPRCAHPSLHCVQTSLLRMHTSLLRVHAHFSAVCAHITTACAHPCAHTA
eukprot:3495222-Rhodomonas_salina.2